MAIYLGIDFGTSTNYITRWNEENNSVKAVPNMDPTLFTGDEVFPNVIYYRQNDNSIVGTSAVKFASIDPENGVVGVKRRIREDNWVYNIPARSVKMSVFDVTRDLFSYIKERFSEINGGAGIDGVVISVPYAYGNKERSKIRQAAQQAGLKVVDLIEEPVAAAISFGIFKKDSTMGHSEKVLVFDYGGGTLDITVFEYVKTPEGKITIEVLNTEGNRDLGGQILDEILVNKICEKAGIDVRDITDETVRLKFQSELTAKAKELKESYQYWEEDDEEGIDEIISGIKVQVDVTAADIEAWFRGAGVNEKIKLAVDDALFDAGDKGMDPEDIDHVLLVGGSSNLPFVKKDLETIFGKEPEICSSIEVNKMVGYGAGVYCGLKVSNNVNIRVIQKLSYGLGLKVGGKFDRFLEKNEEYGKFSEVKYYAVTANKEKRDIEVYQGNSSDIKKCFLIGKIPISHLDIKNDDKIGIALGTGEDGMVAYKLYVGDIFIEDGQV